MKVSGDAILNAPVEKVWDALNDPAVLVRTIPGCEKLEETSPDTYRMTVTMGVASIKGTYLGQVQLIDQQKPGAFTLKASGAAAPGTVSAEAKVKLLDLGDGRTQLEYDADAVVGGMIGGVGQRVLTGVAKKTAGQFFTAVDTAINGQAPAETAAPAETTGSAGGVVQPAPAAGAFASPASTGPLDALSGGEFVKGALFGAAVALLGAVVGGAIGRRG